MNNELELILRINDAQTRLESLSVQQSELISSIFDDVQKLRNLWQNPRQAKLDEAIEVIESFKPETKS